MIEATTIPSWIIDAQASYQPVRTATYAETDFQRGSRAIDILREKVLPATPGRVEILEVGIGYRGLSVNCPYEPYRITAFLDSQGVDYGMTLIDNDPAIVEDVRKRTNIFLLYYAYNSHDQKNWNLYLEQTNQPPRIIHRKEKGLVFHNYLVEERSTSGYLREGIMAAQVPESFLQKMQIGEVNLINDDIAVVDLPQEKYDFINCSNVLYLLHPQGQQLALYNLAASLKPDGLLLLDDNGDEGRPLLKRYGGWLSETEFKEIGLVHDQFLDSEREIFTLKKLP